MTKKIPQVSSKTAAISLVALLLLTPALCAAWFNLRYEDTAFPNLSLNGKTYSGLSRADARTLLEGDVAYRYKDGMKFTYRDKIFTVSLSELGYEIDATKSIEQVFSYGRGQDILRSVREQLACLDSRIAFRNQIRNKGFLIEASRWQEIAAIETPAKDFSYKFEKGDFVPVAASDGFVIDRDALRRAIEENLSQSKNDAIALELVPDEPKVREDKEQAGLTRARNLLSHSLVLAYKSDSWNVAEEDLGSWIAFAAAADDTAALFPTPDTDKIKDYLVSIVPEVNSEPVNARLEFKDGKVSVFALSHDGIELDVQESAAAIEKELLRDAYLNFPATVGGEKTIDGKNAIETGTEPVRIELLVRNVAPKLTTDNIDNMGLTTLLATGESDFHGSTKSRIHNITVGAGKFNGALVGPGDTFSFVSILGEVNAQSGYLPELVIKQGKTIPEYGGGLCQVSSTAFRAAVKSGMKITERKNHAYAVKYYAPQGTDATIYPPHPDLAFENNTPNYILIQTRIEGTKLYFDFYGTDDGRKVQTEGPTVYERGEGGAMKTWWKQKVYDKDGDLTFEDTFYSNYKSASLYPTKTNPLE